MYKRREFNNKEKALSLQIREKLEEAELLINTIGDSKEKDYALFFLEEVLLHSNLAIAEAE